MVEIATPAGRLVGTDVEINGARVHAFRGVPYATSGRFAAPCRVDPWTGARDAMAFGPAAPQPVGGPLDGLVPGAFRGTTDEDSCLSLNVWTPAAPRSSSRPVLVWFPGGAFTIGASSQPAYDGARLCAEQEVVVVTCNYRLSEGGIGWVAGILDRLDHCYRYQLGYLPTWRDVDLAPSEVLRRNFWFCALDDDAGMLVRDRIGVGHILVESDYPHADSSWPNTQSMLVRQLRDQGVAEDDARRITWQNASDLFRHPVPDALRR